MLPDVRKAFEQAVNKKISVPRGDKKVLMTRVGIGFEQLLNQFAKVDRYAAGTSWNTPISWTSIFWPNTGNLSRRRSPPNYQAILEASLARRNGAGNLAPAPWVLAPPELLDDDLAEPEATPPSPSKAAAQPEPKPKPKPKPSVTYPKPFRNMTPHQKWAWYPEWCEKHPPR